MDSCMDKNENKRAKTLDVRIVYCLKSFNIMYGTLYLMFGPKWVRI